MLGILTSRTSTYLRNLGAKKIKNKKKHAGAVGSLFFKFVMWLKLAIIHMKI
jgi:hypothetical protein